MTTIAAPFVPDLDEGKFDELLLYICERQITNRSFGYIKLNTLLCMSDFLFFRRWRRSITGVAYICGEFGPQAAGVVDRVAALESSGRLMLIEQQIGGYRQQRPMALDAADLFSFNGAEIAAVEHILRTTDGQSSAQLMDLSNELFHWRALPLGQPLPYEAALDKEDRG